MTREPHDRHLSAELIQGFLDGEASPGDASRVREHTASCARCRAEMEAWGTLFEQLGSLNDVAPSPAFRERVLSTLPHADPQRTPLGARIRAWLAGALGRPSPTAAAGLLHPSAERLQDFLEGLLPRAGAVGVEGHLHACRECRVEVDQWRGVMVQVAQLPRLAPSPEFSERVMAHVRVQLALVTAEPTLGERLQRLAGSITPRTRRRMAALAGAGITPSVTLGLLAYVVFSHPLVTLGNLFSFVWLKGSERFAGVSSGLVQRTTESQTLFRLYQALDVLFSSPGTAVLAFTGLAALTFMCSWVLYRNVVAGQSHAR